MLCRMSCATILELQNTPYSGFMKFAYFVEQVMKGGVIRGFVRRVAGRTNLVPVVQISLNRSHVAFVANKGLTCNNLVFRISSVVTRHDPFLTGEEAAKFGIATELGDFSPPPGTQISKSKGATVAKSPRSNLIGELLPTIHYGWIDPRWPVRNSTTYQFLILPNTSDE